MAIAVAAGLAVSGVQVVDTAAPLGAAAAQAQDVKSAADTVKLEGVFLRDGDTKLADTEEIFKLDADGKFIDEEQNKYKMRFSFDLGALQPGTEITLSTSGLIPPGHTLYGFGFPGSSKNGLPVKVGDTQIGEYDIPNSGTVKITFGDGLKAFPHGGTATVDLNIVRLQGTYNTKDLFDEALGDSNLNKYGFRKEDTLPVLVTRKDGDTTTTVTVEAGNDWNSYFYVAPDYTVKDTYYPNAKLIDGRVDLPSANIQAARSTAFRNKVTLTVKPVVVEEKSNTQKAPWTMLSEAELRANGVTLEAYEQPDATHDRRKKVAVPNDMTGDFKVNDAGELVVEFTNVPAGIAPALAFNRVGGADFRGTARYGFERVDTTSDPVSADPKAGINPFHRLVEDPAGSQGQGFVAKPGISAIVNGAGATKENPAIVSSGVATLAVTLSNAADARGTLSDPVITLSDGSQHTFNGVVIAPGESKVVEIKDFKPTMGQTEEKVGVSYSTGETAQTTVYLSTIPAPVIGVVDQDKEPVKEVVALKPYTLVFTVPDATNGVMEITLPDGTTTEQEIKDGKVEVPYTFREVGTKQIKAAVRASRAGTVARGDQTTEDINVIWPTDLSSIAELKPDCKNALITTGALSSVGLLMILGSQIRIEAIEQIMTETQKKMGIYNEQTAKLAAEWGPRLGTIIGLLMILGSGGNAIAKCQVEGSSIGSSGEGGNKP